VTGTLGGGKYAQSSAWLTRARRLSGAPSCSSTLLFGSRGSHKLLAKIEFSLLNANLMEPAGNLSILVCEQTI
jgi:hypothetical protein